MIWTSRSRRAIALFAVVSAIAAVGVADTSRTDAGAPESIPLGACPTDVCPATPPTLITGVLGSCGDWPMCTSGLQTGRLNRNGIQGTCATPKICDIFTTDPGRDFDAYTIPNTTGAAACVTATLTVLDQAGCNLQMLGYLNTYDPLNICEPQSDFLADAGLSSGIPPNPTSWCGTVPNGDDLIIVVHPITPGDGVGCNYQIALSGDCIPVELTEFEVE